ncbi:MAG TPA: hypothetical protein VFS43_46575 [Polyangiaceae bacterium]|nr:hypothetical protein [Polyangiaceae bacterium]
MPGFRASERALELARVAREAASCGQWGNAGPGTPSGVCGIAASRIRSECLASLQQANIDACSVSCAGCVCGFCTWCSALTDDRCQ